MRRNASCGSGCGCSHNSRSCCQITGSANGDSIYELTGAEKLAGSRSCRHRSACSPNTCACCNSCSSGGCRLHRDSSVSNCHNARRHVRGGGRRRRLLARLRATTALGHSNGRDACRARQLCVQSEHRPQVKLR